MTEQPLRRPTVAIVGSHPKTRTKFDFSRTDADVWVFNEALGSEREEWCPRADGVFQMHQPVIWRSTQNRNDPKHYEWLQNNHDTDVFMVDEFDDVPRSVRYPLVEIFTKFPTAKHYMTSSVAYALALAVYEGYKRIELYGVEMETNTEYGHQRVGVAYWIGFADGQGIDTEFYSDKFFNAPLYGYEGNATIPIEFYEERIEYLDKFVKQAVDEYNQIKKQAYSLMDAWVTNYKTNLEGLDQMVMALAQSAHNFGAVDGSKQLNEKYRDKAERMQEETGTYLIVRQEIEGTMLTAINSSQQKMSESSAIGASLTEKFKLFNTQENRQRRKEIVKEITDEIERWVKSTTIVGMTTGAQIESRHLLAKYDELLNALGGKPQQADEPSEMSMEEDVAVLEGDLEKMPDYR